MVDNTSTGGSNRYQKLSGSGISERLFSWGKVQSEIVSAENEYLEIAGSLSSANRNIEQLKREIAGLTAQYQQATAESAALSEKLAGETAAHQLLKDNYEANTRNWAKDEAVKAETIEQQQATLSFQKIEITRLESELRSTTASCRSLEALLVEKETDLADKTHRCDLLSTEYADLFHEKNTVLDQLASSEETVVRLNLTHKKEIDDLNADFEKRSRLFVPTIHELTRTVDSWKYQRECDLTEIHRLRTALAAREEDIVRLKFDLNVLKDVKKQILTEINRIGFATVKADTEKRSQEQRMKQELEKLAREINSHEQSLESLESDLSSKKETLSTYSAITEEIIGEWKKHADRTKTSLCEAVGATPSTESYGYLVKISGHSVAFAAFAPRSYEELGAADAQVRDVAKNLAKSVASVNCRKEAFVVVPDECMMYIGKSLYASPLCAVEVITPSQVIAAVRTISRFVVYEKTQVQ